MPGSCACGCGDEVAREGNKYLNGHNGRRTAHDYEVRDMGYETPCWVWLRAKLPNGYGIARRDGEHLAHRAYYVRHKGPIPEGLDVDHLCCVRLCVNPDHLEAKTSAENRRRYSKLSLDDVREIRASEESGVVLARRFDVTDVTISSIRLGHTWEETFETVLG